MSKRILPILLALFLLLPNAVSAESENRSDGVLPCSFAAPDEVQSYAAEHLSDGDPFTTVTLHRGETLTMQWDGGVPDGLFFHFYENPSPFEIRVKNAEGKTLSANSYRQADYTEWLPIDAEDAVSVSLIPTVKDLVLSEWRACTSGFSLPFPDAETHADVLVVLDRPGDELEQFGGLFALLCGEHGLSVQIRYVTQASGYETQQCMQALQRMGVTRLPIFGTARSAAPRTLFDAWNILGGESAFLRLLTQQIRTLTPKLILTLDPSQDADRLVRSVIADAVVRAVALSADESFLRELPAHNVQKVYTLCAEGGTTVALDGPLYAFDGMTTDTLAGQAYAFYREKRVFRTSLPKSITLSLVQSTVGEDKAKNDLLEHLPREAFRDYREPTPKPTDTPEPTTAPTPEPTAVPTEAPQSAEPVTPEPTVPANRSVFAVLLPAGIGLAAAFALWLPLRRSKARKLACLALLPLLIGALITVLLLTNVFPIDRAASDKSGAAPTETPQPTEAPTETPTATPSPAPTETPTEIPPVSPDPDDSCFLSEDGEAFESDFENGHWWYKNSVLSIDVKEIHTTYEDRGPLVYYLADIRMREYSSYRSGVKPDYLMPWVFAREDGAVLAITGDCLFNEKEMKGCLIRKGVFYSNAKHADALILDGLQMRVAHRDDFTVRTLMDHGVRDTYSFGPILVENGKVSDSTGYNRVTHPNPRAGIGMIEPGHWIAILTDGRQYDYSMSITLEYFAQMFLDNGCTVAFNMDGGASVGIVFMGEMLNKHWKPHTEDIQRPWIDCLEFGYSEQLPPPSEPTVHDGYRH